MLKLLTLGRAERVRLLKSIVGARKIENLQALGWTKPCHEAIASGEAASIAQSRRESIVQRRILSIGSGHDCHHEKGGDELRAYG